MFRTILGSVLLLAAILGVSGCTTAAKEPEAERAGGKLQVLATTGMVADLARAVGGEHVEVETLMGPGVDPHLYKASPGDVARLQAADLVLANGHMLEGKLGEVLTQVGKSRRVMKVAETLDPGELLASENYADAYDPHVWFDASLWARAAAPIAGAMAEIDPENAATYRENAAAYASELLELHEEIKSKLAEVPEERRVLITAHDAFRYFGRAYGLEVRGVQGLSTETEAGLSEINDLVDLIVARKVRAVFIESTLSERNVQALVEGANQRGAEVTVGGSLFSDAMGAPGTPEGTYIGMLRHNANTIVQALK